MARKYTAELAVGVMAYGYVLVRPRDLAQVDAPRADETHIYLIGTRPRVTIDPTSAQVHSSGFSATCETTVGGNREIFRIDLEYDLGPGMLLESSYPYTEFAVRKFGDFDPVLSGSVVNLCSLGAKGFPAACSNFHVLYVGKAFGTNGERSSTDRLTNHATLQRILAKITPDLEVWLILARIDDLTIMGGIDPSGPGVVSDDEEGMHYAEALRWLHSDVAKRKETVDVAEGGLIRYFEPQHNIQLKSTFPAPDQAGLKALERFDLHAVTVELQVQDLGVLVGSEATEYANWHAQSFEVHFDASRGPFLELFEPAGARRSMVLPTKRPQREEPLVPWPRDEIY